MQKTIKNKLLNHFLQLKSMNYCYTDKLNLNVKKTTNELLLPDNINSLGEIINNCNLCNFSKNKKISNEIYNESKILFIGNVKIDMNSEEGKTFVLILKNVLNINISDINFLSIIKCETNNMNIDSGDEINICKNYILKQIDILKPKLIITFGDSVNYLLNEKIDVMKIRGTILGYNNIKLIPVYEISQVLRNPSLKKDVFDDFKKIKLIMDQF